MLISMCMPILSASTLSHMEFLRASVRFFSVAAAAPDAVARHRDGATPRRLFLIAAGRHALNDGDLLPSFINDSNSV